MSIRIPRVTYAYIPDTIVVHLAKPDEEAENVTVNFIDYVKNVASSELYPTWPENALQANVYAITSIALNRIFTEWYKLRGYNFDITNATQYDQAFVNNRGLFDNISKIVDESFNDYIVREGHIEPYFAQYCDGRISQCDGMYQWGSVDLANQGYTPLEILKYYYGNDISIVLNVPIEKYQANYRGTPFGLGDSGLDIFIMQFSLNRISANFPLIPKKNNINGYYDEVTEAAVTQFQKIYNLPVTGIVDKGTYYKIQTIFYAVTKVSELESIGLLNEDISMQFSGVMTEGSTVPRVELLQYFLNVMSAFYDTIPAVKITGSFGPETRDAIMELQKTMGLPVTGIIDKNTWDVLYSNILGIITTLPPSAVMIPSLRYPGIVYSRGMGIEQPGVFVIQELLAYISSNIPNITYVPYNLVDGVFGPITESAVITFQKTFGLEPNGIVDEPTWNKMVEIYRNLRYGEGRVAGQYPGVELSPPALQ